MFESTFVMKLTEWALAAPQDENYHKCWETIKTQFDEESP